MDESGSIAVNDDPERLEHIAQRSKARKMIGEAGMDGEQQLPNNSILDQLNAIDNPISEADAEIGN